MNAACATVVDGHKKFRSLSIARLKKFFSDELGDDEKGRSLYRMDE